MEPNNRSSVHSVAIIDAPLHKLYNIPYDYSLSLISNAAGHLQFGTKYLQYAQVKRALRSIYKISMCVLYNFAHHIGFDAHLLRTLV
jgi:hypothetical protein